MQQNNNMTTSSATNTGPTGPLTEDIVTGAIEVVDGNGYAEAQSEDAKEKADIATTGTYEERVVAAAAAAATAAATVDGNGHAAEDAEATAYIAAEETYAECAAAATAAAATAVAEDAAAYQEEAEAVRCAWICCDGSWCRDNPPRGCECKCKFTFVDPSRTTDNNTPHWQRNCMRCMSFTPSSIDNHSCLPYLPYLCCIYFTANDPTE